MGQRTTPERPSTAQATIDLDAAGRQVGFVLIPHSPHDDAWGATRVPIAILGDGEGPTLIVEGGNHGDEWEGPIAIAELIRDLAPGDVHGRLILMPATNVPAVEAGRRTSPVDGLNFNRVFPGDPLGSITRQIAAFVADEILPRGDAFLSLHSGGSSLDILPSAAIEPAPDPEHTRRNAAMALAFGAPATVVIGNLGDPRTSTATAVRSGLVTAATELGGGGTVSPGTLALCRRGIRNVMAHLGMTGAPPPAPESRTILALPGRDAYVFAETDGVLELFHENGTEVEKGQPAGRIHVPWAPASAPEVLVYPATGLLYGRRHPGRVRPGNCCAVVAAPWDGPAP